jgi:hypothetical protein
MGIGPGPGPSFAVLLRGVIYRDQPTSATRKLSYSFTPCVLSPSIDLTIPQGGSGGKWQTPHQKAKFAASQGSGKIEPGDVGIWATCAKNQENRAREELLSMFEDVSITHASYLNSG